MFKLFKTIKSIINIKILNFNKKLQIDNCIDLVKDQQLKMAESFKKIKKCILNLQNKIDELTEDIKNEKNETVKSVKSKNITILKNTIKQLKRNKDILEEKIRKSKDSRDILSAKKYLLESIQSVKQTSTNILHNTDFDIDSIMKDIDSNIQEIEFDMRADEELNEILS